MKNYTNMFVNIKILNPDIINIEDIVGDSNCLYHSISYFFTGSESNYPKYRYEIYIHALNKRNTLPNIYTIFFLQKKLMKSIIILIKNLMKKI